MDVAVLVIFSITAVTHNALVISFNDSVQLYFTASIYCLQWKTHRGLKFLFGQIEFTCNLCSLASRLEKSQAAMRQIHMQHLFGFFGLCLLFM